MCIISGGDAVAWEYFCVALFYIDYKDDIVTDGCNCKVVLFVRGVVLTTTLAASYLFLDKL